MSDAALPPTFGEYDPDFLPGEERIRQGDVLEFIGDQGFPAGWRDVLGLVVTANCDLAHGKHWGTVTYVPAIPVDVYVQQFTVPKILTREAGQAEKKVRGFLATGSPEVAERAIEMLDLEYPPEDVAVLLPADTKDTVRAEFDTALRVLRLHRTTLDTLGECTGDRFWPVVNDFAEQLDGLRKPRTAKSGAPAALRNAVKDEAFKNLPGDSLYLSAPSPDHGRGYIAVLRLIRGIDDAAVALRRVDESRDPTRYRARRTARLSTLYSHRVVQQMAAVFTDIGLPDEYRLAQESFQATYVEKLGQ